MPQRSNTGALSRWRHGFEPRWGCSTEALVMDLGLDGEHPQRGSNPCRHLERAPVLLR